jgi:hypothetical protein
MKAMLDYSFASAAKLHASPKGYELFARNDFGISVHWGL